VLWNRRDAAFSGDGLKHELKRRNVMKTIVSRILLAGALVMGANGLMAAPVSDDQFNEWYKKKYGRNTPAEEARLKAERDATAFREETRHVAPAQPNWIEQHFKGKLGRNTPAEEARLKAERDSTAAREEPAPQAAPARSWFDEWYHKKYGRYPGK
jgi:hypothetical protein